jgi:hypothetical protein
MAAGFKPREAHPAAFIHSHGQRRRIFCRGFDFLALGIRVTSLRLHRNGPLQGLLDTHRATLSGHFASFDTLLGPAAR